MLSCACTFFVSNIKRAIRKFLLKDGLPNTYKVNSAMNVEVSFLMPLNAILAQKFFSVKFAVSSTKKTTQSNCYLKQVQIPTQSTRTAKPLFMFCPWFLTESYSTELLSNFCLTLGDFLMYPSTTTVMLENLEDGMGLTVYLEMMMVNVMVNVNVMSVNAFHRRTLSPIAIA